MSRALFQIVADLEPDYCEESYGILRQELNHYFSQEPIRPFLHGGKQSDTKSEVGKASRRRF